MKKQKLLKTSNRKCSWWEEKCSRQPFWPRSMLKDKCFFSCLASLSGFLKDAKSVYLKQRLLACVKRRLPLYIRLLFILFCRSVLIFSYRNFLFHMNYEQVLMFFCFLDWLFILNLNVLCKRSFMKKCEYIRAQISSLLHVYKCVCTCIFVCVWIYV